MEAQDHAYLLAQIETLEAQVRVLETDRRRLLRELVETRSLIPPAASIAGTSPA
jgi:hypothetical protein